jgi:putative membrane protein insertion efficiency factor
MKNQVAVKLIKSYQKNKQIIGVGHCKFYPTCSQYALETYQKFNFFYASILVGIRILCCNPLARRRPYPVKLTKKEKADISFINLLKQNFDNDFIEYVLNINKLPNLTANSFYNYIYDYYYLPSNPTSPVTINDDLVFGTRYIVSNKKERKAIEIKNDKTFQEYLSYVDQLYEHGLLNVKPLKGTITNNTLNLIPIDSLSLEDILKDQQDLNIIVVNNYNGDISLDGFETLNLTNNKEFMKVIKNKQKLIVKTNNFEVFKYLPSIDYSINFFEKQDEINYFYNLNKKKF